MKRKRFSQLVIPNTRMKKPKKEDHGEAMPWLPNAVHLFDKSKWEAFQNYMTKSNETWDIYFNKKKSRTSLPLLKKIYI